MIRLAAVRLSGVDSSNAPPARWIGWPGRKEQKSAAFGVPCGPWFANPTSLYPAAQLLGLNAVRVKSCEMKDDGANMTEAENVRSENRLGEIAAAFLRLGFIAF